MFNIPFAYGIPVGWGGPENLSFFYFLLRENKREMNLIFLKLCLLENKVDLNLKRKYNFNFLKTNLSTP